VHIISHGGSEVHLHSKCRVRNPTGATAHPKIASLLNFMSAASREDATGCRTGYDCLRDFVTVKSSHQNEHIHAKNTRSTTSVASASAIVGRAPVSYVPRVHTHLIKPDATCGTRQQC